MILTDPPYLHYFRKVNIVLLQDENLNPNLISQLQKSCVSTKWGRNGFDGDKEVQVAYRAPSARKKGGKLNIIADDYNYAVAA